MSNNVFFFENRAVYEIIWKNMAQPQRPKMTIQHGACALHAGYLKLQKHTLTICNNYCFSTATMVTRTRLNVTLYVQSACLLVNNYEIVYSCLHCCLWILSLLFSLRVTFQPKLNYEFNFRC
jgi:hypothetical protein